MPGAIKIYNDGIDFEAQGDFQAAVGAFLTAFAMEPTRAEFRAAALKYLQGLTGYRALPDDLMAALEACAADATIDLQALATVLRNLFEDDARFKEFSAACSGSDAAFERALRDGKFTDILTHRLFLAMLERAINISRPIEVALTRLRRKVCLNFAINSDSSILDMMRYFFVAIAQQCIASSFVWLETAEETLAVEKLRSRSDADAILILSAYRPLSDLPPDKVSLLPHELQAVWRALAREREIAPTLAQLTPIAPGLSAQMRLQYEKFPYPRWICLELQQPRTLSRAMRDQMPGIDLPDIPGEGAQVLIAGCGTGKSTMTFAQLHKQLHVTGIDLSRTSLAYAARMAESHNVRNVDFAVADITYISSLEKRYQIIDCSGVLHHMESAAAGLKSLRPLLASGGFMRLAFYSRRGRAEVAAARAFIAERGWTDSVDQMREARQAIFDLEATHPARALIHSADFCNLDGLHDLLFNVHEQWYTPAEIRQMLHECDLRAVGVDTPDLAAQAAFVRRHPAPADRANLDLWEDFEIRFPETFRGMVHVWAVGL